MNYSKILKNWNIEFKEISDEHIQGSPERSIFRTIIIDTKNNNYILEKHPVKNLKLKETIAKVLDFLKDLEEINPYLKNINNECTLKEEDHFWMLTKFIIGSTLKRPDYIYDKEIGKNLANFLIKLKKNLNSIPFIEKDNFYTKDYILDFEKKLDKDIYERLKETINFLKDDFFEIESDLKTSLCHGDIHPMNIIWDNKNIKSLIDWEFIGYKPESYDLANLIGCIGFENPDAFDKGLIPMLIKTLKENNYLEEKSWQYLPHLILSIRFGWLREWIQKSDKEMLDLEIIYMTKVLRNLS